MRGKKYVGGKKTSQMGPIRKSWVMVINTQGENNGQEMVTKVPRKKKKKTMVNNPRPCIPVSDKDQPTT